jgi:hypothetical protein
MRLVLHFPFGEASLNHVAFINGAGCHLQMIGVLRQREDMMLPATRDKVEHEAEQTKKSSTKLCSWELFMKACQALGNLQRFFEQHNTKH